MNGTPAARESLKSFYGYKETFGRETVWVSVPSELTFVHTNNPYDDEDGRRGENALDGDATLGNTQSRLENEESYTENRRQAEYAFNASAYPAYATHGLEALSAVASQDQYNYAPPPAQMTQLEATVSLGSQHVISPQDQHATPSQNLDFILNPTGQMSPPNNIDPRLHSETPSQHAGAPLRSPEQSMQSSTHVRAA